MDFRTNRYIYFPVLVALIYFGLEKACMHPSMKKLTQPDAVSLYFDYKSELLDEMDGVYRKIHANSGQGKARKKIFMVLGSSRLMFFSYPQFVRNFPDWEIFNFSAPVTAPAYYAYILERTLERGIKPDYILIEADPYQFNVGSNVFVRSNLAHSFDFRFILNHISLFSADEISYYLARNLFAGFKYPPWPSILRERLADLENPKLKWLNLLDQYQRDNRGAGRSLIPRENWFQRDVPWLEGIAEKDILRMYGNYSLSDRQFEFLKYMLDMARKNKIAVLMLTPQVSRPMERMVNADRELTMQMQLWDSKFRQSIAPYQYPYLNLSNREDFYCNTFVDATHMSLDCYHPMLILVMRQYEDIKSGFRAVR